MTRFHRRRLFTNAGRKVKPMSSIGNDIVSQTETSSLAGVPRTILLDLHARSGQL